MYFENTKDVEEFEKFMDEWIYSIENRKEYVKKLGLDRLFKLKARYYPSLPVNYGYYF